MTSFVYHEWGALSFATVAENMAFASEKSYATKNRWRVINFLLATVAMARSCGYSIIVKKFYGDYKAQVGKLFDDRYLYNPFDEILNIFSLGVENLCHCNQGNKQLQKDIAELSSYCRLLITWTAFALFSCCSTFLFTFPRTTTLCLPTASWFSCRPMDSCLRGSWTTLS